ncbi:hypothetical protein V9W64_10850 [Neisseria leonii]|uniref:Uncharacterized protein n=1 Tax=Neisseria leonii TaxID=2995413 RepID=A0A9X4I9V1_9NEIS|nr:hypothetical protein [Neisseria sp. 51.81]MDD9326740.1 hypothetical protein [Neisseria sp. 51.81]
MSTAILYGRKGRFEVQVDEKIYERAHDAKCSVPQYLEREFGADVDAKEHGTVFEQMLAQCNMNLTRDPVTGLGAASLRAVMDGSIAEGANAAITKEAVPLSRILMPAATLALVEKNRAENRANDVALFERMLAVDTSIAGNRYEQPVFDASGAELQEVSRIGQLQVPNIIGKLTVSENTGSIPTFSYGLEISDEARKAMTIDQVAIYLARMATSQAAARLDAQIAALVNGNKAVGQEALGKVKANTFDTAAAGKLTHRAYVKWLRQNRRIRTVDYVLCDEETYFKVVDREGRPKAATVHVEDKEIHAYDTRVLNYGFEEPQIFIVNNGVIPTDTLVGLDSRFAVARIRNSEADYQAAEELVMRKGTQMRFDEGSTMYRLDDTAFTVLDLTA